MYDDPKDLEPLTPNHLLLLCQEASPPPGVFEKKSVVFKAIVAASSRFGFWCRWKREYLPLLQERQKWLLPRRSFSVGETVIIADEQSPRNLWPFGRVNKVYPDSSGFVERVKVLTKKSTLELPVR